MSEVQLAQENAVIGWVIRGGCGNTVAKDRINYQWVPVCTVQYKPENRRSYHEVGKPLGLWGI